VAALSNIAYHPAPPSLTRAPTTLTPTPPTTSHRNAAFFRLHPEHHFRDCRFCCGQHTANYLSPTTTLTPTPPTTSHQPQLSLLHPQLPLTAMQHSSDCIQNTTSETADSAAANIPPAVKCGLCGASHLLANCRVPVYWNIPLADQTYLFGCRQEMVQCEEAIRVQVSACASGAVRHIKVTCVTEYPILQNSAD
jgi:hypothetical protein